MILLRGQRDGFHFRVEPESRYFSSSWEACKAFAQSHGCKLVYRKGMDPVKVLSGVVHCLPARSNDPQGKRAWLMEESAPITETLVEAITGKLAGVGVIAGVAAQLSTLVGTVRHVDNTLMWLRSGVDLEPFLLEVLKKTAKTKRKALESYDADDVLQALLDEISRLEAKYEA